MCSHRTTGVWGRRWDAYLLAVLTGFTALEITAYRTDGVPATLSAYLRRAAGLEQGCRHRHIGRGAILLLLSWAGAHLGFGLFGLRVREVPRG